MKTLLIALIALSLIACSDEAVIIEPDREEYELEVIEDPDIELCELQGGIVAFTKYGVMCQIEGEEIVNDFEVNQPSTDYDKGVI